MLWGVFVNLFRFFGCRKKFDRNFIIYTYWSYWLIASGLYADRPVTSKQESEWFSIPFKHCAGLEVAFMITLRSQHRVPKRWRWNRFSVRSLMPAELADLCGLYKWNGIIMYSLWLAEWKDRQRANIKSGPKRIRWELLEIIDNLVSTDGLQMQNRHISESGGRSSDSL